MGNQDKGIFIVLKVALQPLNMLDIQIISRLIQKENVWFFQQKLCQQNLGSLASGKFGYVLVQSQFI